MKKSDRLLIIVFIGAIFGGSFLSFPRALLRIIYDNSAYTSSELEEIIGIKSMTTNFVNYELLYPFSEEENLDLDENVISEKSIQIDITKKLESYVSDYLAEVEYLKTVFEEYTTTKFPFKEYTQGINDAFNDRILKSNVALLDMDKTNDSVILNDKMLCYLTPKVDMEEKADAVTGVADFCESNDIYFSYVQIPAKIREGETYDWPLGVRDYANENMDSIVSRLNKNGVNCIVLRQELSSIYTDAGGGYYLIDPHWKATTAFEASEIIASELNNNGWDIDMLLFERANYSEVVFENSFYNMKGRMAFLQRTKPEDFSVIVPEFACNMSMEIPDYCRYYEGDFEDVFINLDYMDSYVKDKRYVQTAYSTYQMINAPLIKIHNYSEDAEDKKILIIGDSMGWSMTPYLSLGVSEVHVIYRKSFGGSIRTYIEKMNPDAVIVMYGTAEMVEDVEGSHFNFWDFQ